MDPLARGIASQWLAGLSMLKDVMDRCPEDEWNESRGDYPFSQVAFHALFDCDYHLCDREDELKAQAFHRENREVFADYPELDDRMPERPFERDFLDRYHGHCVEKVASVILPRTRDELSEPNSDVTGTMTRLERYVNAVRHLQHHAAQLGLRLQLLTGAETEWIGRGMA